MYLSAASASYVHMSALVCVCVCVCVYVGCAWVSEIGIQVVGE